MRKLWLIFSYEFKRHVLRKRFVFALLSMPLFMGVIVGVGLLSVATMFDPGPVGYVDLNGFLADPVPLEKRAGLFPTIDIIAFPSEAAARRAFEAKEIKGFYIISEDYLATGKVKVVAEKPLQENIVDDFAGFLQVNLTRHVAPDVVTRLVKGYDLEIRTLDNNRSAGDETFFNFFIPLILGILFMIAINTSGGYVVQALVEEKENRTMEIVVTSVSSSQLMVGKVLGDIAVGLTQLFVWIIFAVLAVALSGDIFKELKGFSLDWGFILLTVATFLPAFVMLSGLMAIVGATAVERTEAQQVAGLFTMPIIAPFWFLWSLMEFPNSGLAIGLSMFPLTAPISLPIRAFFTDVPAWQVAISLGLLVLSAIGALWLAGKAFRLGMLRYGKGISLAEVLNLRFLRRKSREAAHE